MYLIISFCLGIYIPNVYLIIMAVISVGEPGEAQGYAVEMVNPASLQRKVQILPAVQAVPRAPLPLAGMLRLSPLGDQHTPASVLKTIAQP